MQRATVSQEDAEQFLIALYEATERDHPEYFAELQKLVVAKRRRRIIVFLMFGAFGGLVGHFLARILWTL